MATYHVLTSKKRESISFALQDVLKLLRGKSSVVSILYLIQAAYCVD